MAPIRRELTFPAPGACHDFPIPRGSKDPKCRGTVDDRNPAKVLCYEAYLR